MSKLIVVCGLGGSGKTTTARMLSRKLNITCLHKDSIKATIHDVLDLLTPKALGLLLKLTEEQLNNNVDLIIEGPFNFKEDVLIFKKRKDKYDVDLYFVVCNANTDTRLKRVQSRERHICHEEADKKLLNQIKEEVFDYSIMPGKQIKIETNIPTEQIVDKIIKKLK